MSLPQVSAKATSEWHRRMTSDNLSQNGKKINLEDYRIGSEVYFYKPPTALESEKKGRKAKHMDHYAGPAKIIKQIGKRSFLIEYSICTLFWVFYLLLAFILPRVCLLRMKENFIFHHHL